MHSRRWRKVTESDGNANGRGWKTTEARGGKLRKQMESVQWNSLEAEGTVWKEKLSLRQRVQKKGFSQVYSFPFFSSNR